MKIPSISEFSMSIVPTAFAYTPVKDYIKSSFPPLQHPMFTIFFLVAVTIGLAIIISRANEVKYRKQLAEILAIGYFSNFTGKLADLLDKKTPLTFLEPHGQEQNPPSTFPNHDAYSFTLNPDQITIEVIFPKNQEELERQTQKIREKTKVYFVKNLSEVEPFWLRAAVTYDANGGVKMITVYETPRTLFSLQRYIGAERLSDRRIRKLFRYFNTKIEHLKSERGTMPINFHIQPFSSANFL